MLKIFWSFLILVAIALPLHAELYYEGGYNPNQTLQQQLAEDNPRYPRPIIFVFYDNNPCYECPQTIELIENIYNKYFADQYDFYIINYQDDENYNFIQNYNLSLPLEVVLQRVEDGQMTAFRKLEYLQIRFPTLSVSAKTFNTKLTPSSIPIRKPKELRNGALF